MVAAERNDEGELRNVRTLVRGRMFDQVYTPVFSPDGTQIAYSIWRKGGFRDIEILNAQTGKVRVVTRDRSLDANPTWSGDGTKLYFASDRGGIFNIYQYRLSDGRLRQVTNVKTLAIQPTVSEDGRWLVYVGYRSTGYDLFAMKLDESRFLKPLPPVTDRPDPYPDPPPVKMTKSRYNPIPTLRPFAYSFEYAPGTSEPTRSPSAPREAILSATTPSERRSSPIPTRPRPWCRLRTATVACRSTSGSLSAIASPPAPTFALPIRT